jgi:hypothetical protein
MKKYILSVFVLFTAQIIFAQADPFATLDSGVKAEPEYVTATFKGTRLINFHTVETPGKRTLDFRISHRFGDITTGVHNFYGLDGPASLWLGLDYSYDGRLVFSIGRVNVEKLVTSSIKYKLMRQSLRDNSRPVTISLLAGSNIITDYASVPNEYEHVYSRMNFTYQIMIARKFNQAFSLQLSPTMLHFNEVRTVNDKNDIFSVPLLARYKFSRSVAVTGEYGLNINNLSDKTYFRDVVGVGFDVETGGHVFQLFFSNAFGIAESQTIPSIKTRIDKGPWMLGFNISRVFTL